MSESKPEVSEWQVHRWEETARSYLENLTRLIQQSFKERKQND